MKADPNGHLIFPKNPASERILTLQVKIVSWTDPVLLSAAGFQPENLYFVNVNTPKDDILS